MLQSQPLQQAAKKLFCSQEFLTSRDKGLSSLLRANCGQKDLIVKMWMSLPYVKKQWCGEERGLLAGDGLKQSHPEVWDAQPTRLLETFATRAGLIDKEGSTCPHPWDTEASL